MYPEKTKEYTTHISMSAENHIHQIEANPVADQIKCITQCYNQSSAHKATVPLSKIREKFIEAEENDVMKFKCETCSQCQECKQSNKTRNMTRQERIEQNMIMRSVHMDYENKKVWVDLPFMKSPTEYLHAVYKKNNNKKMALQVYKQQCQKPDQLKQQMRAVHQDLVKRGFMKKLHDLTQEQQDVINNAPFWHFFPWRITKKSDSTSTPIRVVVDPTQTKLNLILAKGENRLAKVNNILIKARFKKYVFSTDIQKMYNQLHLKPKAHKFFHNF